MSLHKLKGLIGQGAKAGRKMYLSTNKWAKKNFAFEKNESLHTGKQTLNFISLHERTGTRGEGMGMGHRNVQRRAK